MKIELKSCQHEKDDIDIHRSFPCEACNLPGQEVLECGFAEYPNAYGQTMLRLRIKVRCFVCKEEAVYRVAFQKISGGMGERWATKEPSRDRPIGK
jgi:hypothetical protein